MNFSLTPGFEKIGEDISLLNGSDFLEEITDSDFDDESDCNLSATMVSPEEYGNDIYRSGVEQTEIIRIYKMTGLRSSSTVCVEVGKFSWPSASGKVLTDEVWKSAKNVKIEVMVIFSYI